MKCRRTRWWNIIILNGFAKDGSCWATSGRSDAVSSRGQQQTSTSCISFQTPIPTPCMDVEEMKWHSSHLFFMV